MTIVDIRGQAFPGTAVPDGAYVFTTVAGFVASDESPQLKYPSGITRDSQGNLYFSDSGHHVIRKLAPSGKLTVAGGQMDVIGSGDGAAAQSTFWYPSGVAIDADDNLYVADSGNRSVRKISASGVVSTIAGYAGSTTPLDGVGTEARFSSVDHLTCDNAGSLYLTDSQSHTVRKIVLATRRVTTIAGQAGLSGTADGVGAAARFGRPHGIAADGKGFLFIVDHDGHTLRKMELASGMVTTIAGSRGLTGSNDGTGAAARFSYPTGVSLDAAGNAYVADWNNYTLRKVTPAGVVTTVAGRAGARGNADGPRGLGLLDGAQSSVADPAGNLFIADWRNHLIRKLTPDGVLSTLAGVSAFGAADGVGSSARFNFPVAPAVDATGNVYLIDRGNFSLRKISPERVVTTLSQGVFGQGLAIGANGYLYLASDFHEILKIDSEGRRSIVAGSAGVYGSADGVGDAARFRQPAGIAVDGAGNIYVADSVNYTVRKIAPGNIVTTLAGRVGEQGFLDGVGTAARFGWPNGVAVAPDGTVFVADMWNGTIRRITASGVVTTLAGAPGDRQISDGVGSGAKFNRPNSIAIDPDGNLLVTESIGVIRKITPAGVVTTIGGFPQVQAAVDGVGTASRFWEPIGIAVDATGSVYITDTGNNTLRLAQNVRPSLITQPVSQKVTPGTVVTLTASARGNGPLAYQWYKDGVALSGAIQPTLSLGPIAVGSDGNYTVTVSNTVAATSSEPATLSIHIPPSITAAPRGAMLDIGDRYTLSVEAGGLPAPIYQWRRNGIAIEGATAASFDLVEFAVSDAGAYDVVVSNSAGVAISEVAMVGLASTVKAAGDAYEIVGNVTLPNGRTYDQVLLTGKAATITADPGEVTRMSFIDLSDDIVQVEFSGSGTLTLTLEGASGPALPLNYNQEVSYMKGHASIVIVGADESTNVSVFSVGRLTGANPSLYRDIYYDGVADLAMLSIAASNGRVGGVRAGNASFYAHKGVTGVYAPGVEFNGPLYLGDLNGFDDAAASILVGRCEDVRITGGDLAQANGRAVQISGVAQLRMVDGMNSHGVLQPGQQNRATIEDAGRDVTAEIVVNPAAP